MSKLKDICYDMHQGINTVADKVEYFENGYPILQSKNITKGILDLEDVRYVDEKTYNYYKEKYNPKENDILLANIGTIGKSVMVKQKNEFLIAWNIFLIKVNKEKIIPQYLKIFFDYLFITKYYDKFLTGGTVKFINKKTMGDIDVPNVNIEEQEAIVNKVEIVQNIIQLKKQQIEKLDELIKSQFVEMFGDPFLNNKKWELKKLSDISISIADGSNVNRNYYKTKGDVLFLRIQNVWRNEFRLEDSVFISEEENEEYIDTSLRYGDILICKIGRNYTKDTSLGRVAIYLGEDGKANYSNNIMKIRLTDKVNSKFVNILLNLEDYQNHIKRVSKGGTDKRALSKSIIGDLPIIIPPKVMQDEYINIIEQINKQKFEIQKSLEEMQLLQEGLMNKYFNIGGNDGI